MFCPYLHRSDPRCIASKLSSRNLDDFIFICGDDYEGCEVYAKIKQELAERMDKPDENSAQIDYSKIESLISETEEQAASAQTQETTTSQDKGQKKGKSHKGNGRKERNINRNRDAKQKKKK